MNTLSNKPNLCGRLSRLRRFDTLRPTFMSLPICAWNTGHAWPGATLENELNALDAINTCDVILWAVNAQNIAGPVERHAGEDTGT